MKVLCLGGGPAGLYFAISMKLRDPSHQVTVLERNKANDTFGWGVVLSDDALGRMQKNDPKSTDAIRSKFAYWDDIAVVRGTERPVSGGHGFAGIGRKAGAMGEQVFDGDRVPVRVHRRAEVSFDDGVWLTGPAVTVFDGVWLSGPS